MKHGTKLYYQGNNFNILEYTYIGKDKDKYVVVTGEGITMKYAPTYFNKLCLSKIMILSETEQALRRKLEELHKEMREFKLNYNPLDTVLTVYSASKSNLGKAIPVHQYDMDTGKYIASFRSAKQGAWEVGNTLNSTHVSCACKGKRKTCYGYRWSYEKVSFLPCNKTIRKKVQINEYDLEGKLLNTYPSITEAGQALGCHITNLARALKSRKGKFRGKIYERHITN